MTSGVELRAQIDADIMRALLLVNSGAAVALIALLPYVLDRPDLSSFARVILMALLGYQLALFSAVVSGRLRRVCSLEYEKAKSSSPQGVLGACKLFGHDLGEPCVCIWATILMWASLTLFILSGATVAWGGYQSLAESAALEAACDA